ncbi:hypothetical protein NSK_004678 [Nannochloropsis salina CCMP1776]|uniref:Fungal lipase-type domain-containing protein n=1 Tax=Nannochloropsis salina CCMP1776 TaxID=1027361 RepID=A0A4D9CWF0_9STRA|nr:hypothetical protein NSK_004678 [Nannochloropsis salina CCMP1776]|eukprot:TFJ83572.1 hypothetical protein NSK_004678 [Nannochloropsis salina CCMP1776]
MLDYAAAAYYCRTSACEAWACSACSRHPRTEVRRVYDNVHNGNGFVGWDPVEGVVVVSFAGTDTSSVANWIDDLDEVKTPWPLQGCQECKVHAGFLTTYSALRPQLQPLVEALVRDHPQAPVWVTGHSLGAALAVLCMVDLLSLSYPVRAVVNFGQPRVGNQHVRDAGGFSSFVAAQSASLSLCFYRLVHHRDPVPHLPPASFGFHHSPFEVFYTKNETYYHICDATGEDKHCSDHYLIDPSIKDHLNYLGLLFGGEEVEGRLQELMHSTGWEMEASVLVSAS